MRSHGRVLRTDQISRNWQYTPALCAHAQVHELPQCSGGADMHVSTRAVAWSLGVFTVALLAAAILAMTGLISLDDTVFGTYTGLHVVGVLVAFTGVLALVAALLRRGVRT